MKKRGFSIFALVFAILFTSCSNFLDDLTVRSITEDVASEYSLEEVMEVKVYTSGIVTAKLNNDGTVTFTGVSEGITGLTMIGKKIDSVTGKTYLAKIFYAVEVGKNGNISVKDTEIQYNECLKINPKDDVPNLSSIESAENGYTWSTLFVSLNDDGTIDVGDKNSYDGGSLEEINVEGTNEKGESVRITYNISKGPNGELTKNETKIFVHTTFNLDPKDTFSSFTTTGSVENTLPWATLKINDDGTVALTAETSLPDGVNFLFAILGTDEEGKDLSIRYMGNVSETGEVTVTLQQIFYHQEYICNVNDDGVSEVVSVTLTGSSGWGGYGNDVKLTDLGDGKVSLKVYYTLYDPWNQNAYSFKVQGKKSDGTDISVSYSIYLDKKDKDKPDDYKYLFRVNSVTVSQE